MRILSIFKKSTITTEIPLFTESISCGFPSPAEDYIETPLDLNELLIKKPAATFFVRAKGDSMTGAGIFSGDILVIDRSRKPVAGSVVVAVIDGEFTLKRLVHLGNERWLYPENPKYKPIKINIEQGIEIWGVATSCIHNL